MSEEERDDARCAVAARLGLSGSNHFDGSLLGQRRLVSEDFEPVQIWRPSSARDRLRLSPCGGKWADSSRRREYADHGIGISGSDEYSAPIDSPKQPYDTAGLLAGLQQLTAEQDQRTQADWDRTLPLAEAITDRWERAADHGWGTGTGIYHLSYVYGDVRVGENTWIGPYTLLDGSGGITIGDYCSISSGVQIYSHTVVKFAVSGGAAPYEHAPTRIGDRCFIGPQSVVAMGVTIAPGCVVGAHSYVNRDLPESAIAVGSPARVVGRVAIEDDEVRFVYD